MRTRSKKQVKQITVPFETFAKLAAEFVPIHAAFVSGGHELLPSSRVWRRQDGTFTGRFIYRSPLSPSIRTTFVVKGMRFE